MFGNITTHRLYNETNLRQTVLTMNRRKHLLHIFQQTLGGIVGVLFQSSNFFESSFDLCFEFGNAFIFLIHRKNFTFFCRWTEDQFEDIP